MSQQHIILKPDPVNALAPLLWKAFKKYALASFVAYWIFWVLIRFGLLTNVSTTRLIWALVLLPIVLSLYVTKMKFLRYHNTKYHFYDTHLVSEYRLLVSTRQSVPYKQITSIRLDAGLWDRISKACDIVLSTSSDHDKDKEIVLKSIKNPHDVERQIYALMHKENEGIAEEKSED